MTVFIMQQLAHMYIHRVRKKRGHGFFCITLTSVDTVS